MDAAAYTFYVCDFKSRGMCEGSPYCVGNGGPCESTLNPDYAIKDENGNPVIQIDDSK